MSKFRAEIRKARPRLYTIAPLTFWVLCCFVVLNAWLGLSFFLPPDTVIPPIENHVMTDNFWGIIYMIMAASLGWGIMSKNWELAKYSMVFGLFIKSIFLYALLVIGIQRGFVGTFPVTGLWVFAVLIQLGAVIYFAPPRTPESGRMVKRKYE